MVKRMAFLVLVVLVLSNFSFAGSYGGGSGTEADPYQIWTPVQMNAIGANDGDWDKCFRLMDNIDMPAYTGTQYNIIGNFDTNFTGTFDGNGYVISNLSYTTTEAVNNIGLFGLVGVGGKIHNLGVENVSISSDRFAVGGLVGYNYKGSITDCYVTGSVIGYRYIGGLVGKHRQGTITSCYANASVTGTGNVGGLVGENDRGTITNCYATSSVTGKIYVGGLLGRDDDGLITDCYATGSVIGYRSIGGLVGGNDRGTITNCYATGSVIGNIAVGGLCGYYPESYRGGITNSFWDVDMGFISLFRLSCRF